MKRLWPIWIILEALPLDKEDNPALGVRGLRVYRLYPEVFKTQLRALLRASVYGNKNGIKAGICGELAMQRELIGKWNEIGVDYLSAAPSYINRR